MALHFLFLIIFSGNDKIDINSATGKQIFKHEVAHVQEKHSYDKIFINIVLIFFWCNPFFWLIRKELNIIHEFIADKKALDDSDTAAFAAMILQATYPLQQFTITNNFFYSPLKRRLAHVNKKQKSEINYASRLAGLASCSFGIFSFYFKSETT
ncbi:MAG: M56 family metallopeptidase [Chitinophagaceae bacterium]